MSLIAHLVRATLAPERAVRPLLPQAYANWRGDNAEWEDAIEPVREGAPPVVSPAPGAVRRSEAALDPADAPASPRRAARVERGAEAAAVAPPPKSPPLPAAPVVEMPREVVDATAQQAPRRVPRPAAAHQPKVAPVAVVPDGAARVADRPILEAPAASRHGVADTVPGRGAPRHRVGLEHALEAPAPRAPIADLRRVAMPDIPLSKPDQNEAVATPLLLEPLSTPREVMARKSAGVRSADPLRPAWARADDAPIAEAPRAPVPPPSLPAAPLLVAPQTPPAEPAASAQRAPDVHISIGRVEVRAAAAPPPAKRAEAARAEPLSLEAYLARRNGTAK